MSIELKNSDPMYEILQNLSVGFFSISDSLNKKISEVQKGRKSRGGSWWAENAKNKTIMDRMDADQKRCNVILLQLQLTQR